MAMLPAVWQHCHGRAEDTLDPERVELIKHPLAAYPHCAHQGAPVRGKDSVHLCWVDAVQQRPSFSPNARTAGIPRKEVCHVPQGFARAP